MFTGLIEAVGRVTAVATLDAGARKIEIEAPFTRELTEGQSVSLDGACLTVTEAGPRVFSVTAVPTTLEKTVAGTYGEGTLVNLERALRLGDRLDGHLVQGHVDGIGEFLGGTDDQGGRVLRFRLPSDVAGVTIPQGSVTLSGISLTVSLIPEPGICEVAIIPHTWENTNLRQLTPGDGVNVEGDLIGKYVRRALGPWRSEYESVRGV